LDDVPLGVLFGALLVLILISAFFSGSETGMMALNRYRLRHLARAGHRGAKRVSALLDRPDRLIGLILLGNNFVNILASSIATLIGLRLMGEAGIALAAALLTVVILIFSEVAPKTLAALHPERIAFTASYVVAPLLRVLYPLVYLINSIANGLLRLFGLRPDEAAGTSLSSEELRTVLNEAGAMMPRRHQKMLLSILDLEKVTVDDVMIPRHEIVGIDLNDRWETVVQQLTNTQHTRLPVYRDSIDNIAGMLHVRNALRIVRSPKAGTEALMAAVVEPYFVPEGTPLNTQLLNFQHVRRRIGLVVDEYGDILGLITLEDILEEIVGEFTTGGPAVLKDIQPLDDGSYLVDGAANIRQLDRVMHWHLPTDGPKTLNGLVMEYLETIPEPGTSLRIGGYPIEIVQTKENAVKTVRVYPRLPVVEPESGSEGKHTPEGETPTPQD
jgi:magnesium and cobalt exporter, CNNM family